MMHSYAQMGGKAVAVSRCSFADQLFHTITEGFIENLPSRLVSCPAIITHVKNYVWHKVGAGNELECWNLQSDYCICSQRV